MAYQPDSANDDGGGMAAARRVLQITIMLSIVGLVVLAYALIYW